MKTSRCVSVAALCTTLMTGCMLGRNRATPVGERPQGAELRIEQFGSGPNYWSSTAELIAVADSGFYARHGNVLVFYPLGTPVEIRTREGPGTTRVDMRSPSMQALDRYSMFARHPFGLTDAQLLELAASMGRDSITVRREP